MDFEKKHNSHKEQRLSFYPKNYLFAFVIAINSTLAA